MKLNIKDTRLELLAKQGNRCALCQEHCSEEEAVLDHCHKGGWIRAVLHRGCNALLGRIENNAPRHGLRLARLESFLAGASAYVRVHSINATGLMHPSHLTAEEKKARLKKRRLRARKVLLRQPTSL